MKGFQIIVILVTQIMEIIEGFVDESWSSRERMNHCYTERDVLKRIILLLRYL